MAKYDFRILIETDNGQKFSYVSSSIMNSAIDTNYAISSSDLWNRITSSKSCSYSTNYDYTPSLSSGGEKFGSGLFVSSSLTGSLESGSIIFHNNTVNPKVNRLKRFKFLSSDKFCQMVGLDENFWYTPYDFKIKPLDGGEKNYLKANVDAYSLSVLNNLNISGLGSITSDLPFKIDKLTSRYISFENVSGSDLPNKDLIMGYDEDSDNYVLKFNPTSPSGDLPKFNISGVNSLEVTHMTSSYVTSSVQQIYTEITSSGNSLFGDAITDTHTFNGHITSSGIISASGTSGFNQMHGLKLSGDLLISQSSPGIYLYDTENMSPPHPASYFRIEKVGSNVFLHNNDSSGSSDLNIGTYRTGNYFIHIDDEKQSMGIGTSNLSTGSTALLTVAGHISASGDLKLGVTNSVLFDTPAVNDHRVLYTPGLGLTLHSSDGISVLGDITASGHISSSDATKTGSFGFGVIRNKLGVGTNSPTKKLEVAGDISMSGALYGSGGGEGTISASGLITAKQYQSYPVSWYGDPGTNEFSLPWGSTFENANLYDEAVGFLAPCNMNIKHVLMRSQGWDQNLSGTPTITWRVKRHTPYGSSITTEGNWETMEKTTTILDTSADTGATQLIYAKFSGSHANGGDVLGVTFQFNSDFTNGSDEFYATVVAEHDYNTLPIVSDSTGSLYTGSGYFGTNG